MRNYSNLLPKVTTPGQALIYMMYPYTKGPITNPMYTSTNGMQIFYFYNFLTEWGLVILY